MTVLETDYVSYLTYLICNEAFPMVLPVIASTNGTLVRSNLPSGLESKFQEGECPCIHTGTFARGGPAHTRLKK